MDVQEKTIEKLVSENHSVAEALHFLGIHFHNYSEKTLEEVCQEMGLKVETIIEKIKKNVDRPDNDLNFEIVPTHLLVEYLKHNHYIFIKQRLPFILSLIKNFDGSVPEIKNELKLVFPLFVEDFVSHIYEEEDTLFHYILLLNKSNDDPKLFDAVKSAMQQHSIISYQTDHEIHDDHLKGLRELTNNYMLLDSYDLNTKVVLTELKKMDEELHLHAMVENNILFPRALQLEKKVFDMINSSDRVN